MDRVMQEHDQMSQKYQQLKEEHDQLLERHEDKVAELAAARMAADETATKGSGGGEAAAALMQQLHSARSEAEELRNELDHERSEHTEGKRESSREAAELRRRLERAETSAGSAEKLRDEIEELRDQNSKLGLTEKKVPPFYSFSLLLRQLVVVLHAAAIERGGRGYWTHSRCWSSGSTDRRGRSSPLFRWRNCRRGSKSLNK
jgi:hypothetical protein